MCHQYNTGFFDVQNQFTEKGEYMRTKPIVFYISGPYRGSSESDVLNNIAAAREEGLFIIQKGGSFIAPHLNTAFMGGVVPDENFLQMDLYLLARCDVVFAIERWQNSKGARAEVEFAQKLGIPVVYTRLEVLDVISKWSSSSSGSLVTLLRKMYGLLKKCEYLFNPNTERFECPACDGHLVMDQLGIRIEHDPNCLYVQSVAQARLVLGDPE